jgi:hypothetical protein
MSFWNKQTASRIGRSIVTFISSATTSSTPFSAQTYQIRLSSTLPVYVSIGTAATVTSTNAALLPANAAEYFSCTAGQVLNFISTSTSSGAISFTEML